MLSNALESPSSDTRSFDKEDMFGHDSGVDTISLTIPPAHPAHPEKAINEYDDAALHAQCDRMDLNMEDVTAMIRALCASEGIDVASVSGEAEGSHSDVPSQVEQCSSNVDV
ncbi:hypothetical protein EI94DRAFT_1799086 [Lactarius quietus]|nr:hypothetical protein EI94DRAFT_1799086 [Lactarius quietus]